MKNAKNQQPNTGTSLVEMGIFSAAHGVRGQVKLRSFTAIAEDITAYGPLQDKQGSRYHITISGQVGDMLLASVEGITNRTEAEKLKNIALYVPRSALPPLADGEYYQADLVGIQVSTEDGAAFGTILSVHNFGAGTLVNIALTQGGEAFFPFNPTIFPRVDTEAKQAVIYPPEIVFSDRED